MPVSSRIFNLVLWVFLLAFAPAAFAQSDADIGQRLTGYSSVLETIDAALKRDGISDQEVEELRIQASEIGDLADEVAASLQPALAELLERRQALSPQSADGTETAPVEESETLAQERQVIEGSIGRIEEFVKRSNEISARANQLAARAAAIERQRFTSQVFERGDSILDPRFWRVAIADLPAAWSRIENVAEAIFHRFVSRGMLALIPVILVVFSIAIVTFPAARSYLVRLIAGRIAHGQPTDLSKGLVAFLVAIVVVIVPMAGLYLARIVTIGLDLAAPTLTTFIDRALLAVLITSASIGFARAILAPNRPEWRLAVAAQDDAVSLTRNLVWSAFVIGFGVLVEGTAAIVNVPHSTLVLIGAITSLLFASMVWRTLKPFRSVLMSQDEASETVPIKFFRILRIFGFLAAIAALVIAGAALVGYVSLAWFLCKQVVWVSIILAVYGLLSNLIDSFSDGFRLESTAAGGLVRFAGFGDRTLVQMGIVLLGALKVCLAAIAIIAVAIPWGLDSSTFMERAGSILTGFQAGEIQVSPIAIAQGFLIFIVGLFITRSLRSWLGEKLLPATSLDPGLKNSITTTAGYLGYIVSVVVAFAFIGINLSQLGLVAGALSVGIGFGLQSIVNNFVSGLILLAERPIKAGDWIVVAGEEGTVKKINVRSTELETFDRATVVIPNSDLISGTVQNWVLSGSLGRASIIIGVGYDSDPDQVREILLACARDHDLVLPYPEPSVFFLDFGDSALIFRLDVYLADIGNGFRTRSDLRFELLRRFREAGIEIPFPQRDLNIRNSDELENVISRIKE